MATNEALPITTMINMTPIKLDSTNYLSWRRQILHMVECFDLMAYLDKSTVVPSPTITVDKDTETPNPAYAFWKQKDMKLLSVLYTSLSPDAASEVIDASTSLAAWTTLEAVYSSVSRQHQLREELLSLRRNDSSVADYGRRFKDLCNQLHAIGCPVDEGDKSHLFLRGLGLQFAGFADTRMALNPMPSFRDLLSQAQQYDLMLRAMEGSSPHASFVAHRRGGGRPSSQPGRGFSGGRDVADAAHPGHGGRHGGRGRGFQFGGVQRGRGDSSSGFVRRTPRCQICRGGHYADKCPQFVSTLRTMESADLAQAFNSSCNISPAPSDWYIDSGASVHMTNQQASLDSYAPYTESSDKSNTGAGKM